MRREERFQKILELLDEEGFVTVEDLSGRFFISLPHGVSGPSKIGAAAFRPRIWSASSINPR